MQLASIHSVFVKLLKAEEPWGKRQCGYQTLPLVVTLSTDEE